MGLNKLGKIGQCLALAGVIGSLAGCSGMATRTTETITSYAIYDISPGPDNSAGKIAESIKNALRSSMSSVNIATGIPVSAESRTPGSPARTLVRPFGSCRRRANGCG